jgi:hypothetical protein
MELIKNSKSQGDILLRKDIKIQPYTLKQLARFYRVSKPTMLKWMKPYEQEIGPRVGYMYTAHQVEIILNIFLLPDELDAIRKIA